MDTEPFLSDDVASSVDGSDNNNQKNLPPHNGVLLRLLNGAFIGCEFQLTPGKTLFIAGEKSDENQTNIVDADFPEGSIYIPAMDGGHNFEIIIDERSTSGFTLNVLDPEKGLHTTYANFNIICKSGTINFALKLDSEQWLDDVLHPPKSLANQDIDDEFPDNSDEFINKKSNWRKKFIKNGKRSILMILLTILVAMAAVYNFMPSDEKHRTVELSALLEGSIEKLSILHGRDNVMYIFANSERDATWAKQILVRSNFAQTTKVLTIQDEETKIATRIAIDYPDFAYHVIRLSRPDKPQIIFSLERTKIVDTKLAEFARKITKSLPYASNTVELIPVSDKELITQASSGLKRLGISYKRTDNADSVTFLMQGEIEDGDLQRVHRLIDDFGRKWGNRYVQFSVELKDDAFKGKSFFYGNSSYAKPSPLHWYFAQNF